jgi:transcriptional regulator with XRE-family HTH domain
MGGAIRDADGYRGVRGFIRAGRFDSGRLCRGLPAAWVLCIMDRESGSSLSCKRGLIHADSMRDEIWIARTGESRPTETAKKSAKTLKHTYPMTTRLEKLAEEMRERYARTERKKRVPHDLEPTHPMVIEVDLSKLSDREWRRAWHDSKIRWMIAHSLRTVRTQRGWTQQELSDKSGVPVGTISGIEDPDMKHFPTVNTLLRLASGLDCALVLRFCGWSEWLKMLARMESGAIDLVPSFDEEFNAPTT